MIVYAKDEVSDLTAQQKKGLKVSIETELWRHVQRSEALGEGYPWRPAPGNVLWSALGEHISNRGGSMDQQLNSFGAIIKRPSAFLPLAMSLTALAMLIGAIMHGYVVGHPVVREPDEGAIAHLWQLLMAGQMPFVAFFAIKWLPRAPRQTLPVLAVQAGAALASMAPVFFLNL